MNPILGYRKAVGNQDAQWYGKFMGHDRTFIRVAAGLCMPILDRAFGAIVVVGELYRITAPGDYWILGCESGEWRDVRGAMAQFRKDLKYGQIITDCEEARPLIRKMPEVFYAVSEIPIYTSICPSYALSEVGRSTVDQMMEEGRLHAEQSAIDKIDEEPVMRALCSVICYLRDWPFHYKPSKQAARTGNILGTVGLE